jgi:hypothetical protein
MCDQCAAIDEKIDRYKRLQAHHTDEILRAGLEQLIATAEDQKALIQCALKK